ncbi:hypothetical protein ACFZ8E_05835 [Methylobacterium sp. HMF5984]|uniref:hypothetical protein n=1 Tax=Methylobacterium sp. HMF5984 TaxID=3367370 RepID=UPI003852D699
MADPTTGDLIKAKTIASDEVNAAVDVFVQIATVSTAWAQQNLKIMEKAHVRRMQTF